MLNRVRRSVGAFTAASSRRVYPLALLAVVRPAIGTLGGVTIAAVVVLAAALLASVILAAVFSAKPSRRRDALAVLDRLLPWKAR